MLQIKEYLNDNFVFRYNNLTGATEYKEKGGKNSYRTIDEREMNGIIVDGAPDYLSREEEKVLQKHNKTYYRQSLLEDVFHCCFRHPLEMEKGIWLTTAEIFQVMRKFSCSLINSSVT